MTSTRASRDALTSALYETVRVTSGLHHRLATRLRMSRRTLARYANGEAFPTRARALAMLSELTDLPPDVYARLADALSIESDKRPPLRVPSPAPTQAPVKPSVDHASEQAAVTLMLYVAAEANGVEPAAARKIAMATLDHVASRGLDVTTAREVTRAAAKGVAASARGR